MMFSLLECMRVPFGNCVKALSDALRGKLETNTLDRGKLAKRSHTGLTGLKSYVHVVICPCPLLPDQAVETSFFLSHLFLLG